MLQNTKETNTWDSITYNISKVFQDNDGHHSECFRKYTVFNVGENIIEEPWLLYQQGMKQPQLHQKEKGFENECEKHENELQLNIENCGFS